MRYRIIIALLLGLAGFTATPLVGQDKEKTEDKTKDKTEDKTEDKKEEKTPPAAIEVPKLETPIDRDKARKDLQKAVRDLEETTSQSIPQTLREFSSKFGTFDAYIRRSEPFIDAEMTRGFDNPSRGELDKIRNFWVSSPQSDVVIQEISTLAKWQKSLLEIQKKLKEFSPYKASRWAMPFAPEFEYHLSRLIGALEKMQKAIPPDLLGKILAIHLEKLQKVQTTFESQKKAVIDGMHQYLRKAQLQDQEKLAAFKKAYPGKPLALVEIELDAPLDGTLYEDNGKIVYVWNKASQDWTRLGDVDQVLRAARLLQLNVMWNNDPSTLKEVKKIVDSWKGQGPSKKQLLEHLSPLFPENLNITSLIVEKKNPALQSVVRQIKGLGTSEQRYEKTGRIYAKVWFDEQEKESIKKVYDLFQQYKVITGTVSTGADLRGTLNITVNGEKILDISRIVVTLPSTDKEVVISGTLSGSPLQEMILSLEKKHTKFQYLARLQITEKEKGASKAASADALKALDNQLKGAKKSTSPLKVYRVSSSREPQAIVYESLPQKSKDQPYPNIPLAPYRFYLGGKHLTKVPFPTAAFPRSRAPFMKFYHKHQKLSALYKVPPHLVENEVGHKQPYPQVSKRLNLYRQALKAKNRERAIQLYNEMSGDKNGAKVVDQWLKYATIIEKYQRQARIEDSGPFEPISKKGVWYLRNINLPQNGYISNANASSKYDGDPTPQQLAHVAKPTRPEKGISEGEKYVQNLRQSQKDKHESQKKELAALLKKDLGPRENPGGLKNVWVSKRVIELTLTATETGENSKVDLVVNGKTLFQNKVLTKKPIKVKVTLTIGYNTVKVLARNLGSDGFNSGVVQLDSTTRGPKGQQFFLGQYEVGTMTIHFPSP